jgi:uncharacterized membrane protein
MSDAAQTPAAGDLSLRLFAIIAYVLFLLAFTNGITAIAGVVIASLKRDEARGTIYESHFRNMIAMFWLGIAAMAAVLALVGLGVFGLIGHHGHPPAALIAILPAIGLALVGFAVFYLFRIVKGLARAVDGKAYS